MQMFFCQRNMKDLDSYLSTNKTLIYKELIGQVVELLCLMIHHLENNLWMSTVMPVCVYGTVDKINHKTSQKYSLLKIVLFLSFIKTSSVTHVAQHTFSFTHIWASPTVKSKSMPTDSGHFFSHKDETEQDSWRFLQGLLHNCQDLTTVGIYSNWKITSRKQIQVAQICYSPRTHPLWSDWTASVQLQVCGCGYRTWIRTHWGSLQDLKHNYCFRPMIEFLIFQ